MSICLRVSLLDFNFKTALRKSIFFRCSDKIKIKIPDGNYQKINIDLCDSKKTCSFSSLGRYYLSRIIENSCDKNIIFLKQNEGFLIGAI